MAMNPAEGTLPSMKELSGEAGDHKAFAYGITRTAHMIASADQAQLAEYEILWCNRLARQEPGTTAYSVALGAWTAVLNRGSVPGFVENILAAGSGMVEW